MRFLLLIVGLAMWTTPGAAQRPPVGPVSSPLVGTPAPRWRTALESQADTVERQIQPTHWKEGALVGGVLGALGGALLGHAICTQSEQPEKNCTGTTVIGAVFSAAILAIPGALIGGQFPKGQGAERGS
jgi:tetrahydromethanopterin S-methyltransferase subunit D